LQAGAVGFESAGLPAQLVALAAMAAEEPQPVELMGGLADPAIEVGELFSPAACIGGETFECSGWPVRERVERLPELLVFLLEGGGGQRGLIVLPCGGRDDRTRIHAPARNAASLPM